MDKTKITEALEQAVSEAQKMGADTRHLRALLEKLREGLDALEELMAMTVSSTIPLPPMWTRAGQPKPRPWPTITTPQDGHLGTRRKWSPFTAICTQKNLTGLPNWV